MKKFLFSVVIVLGTASLSTSVLGQSTSTSNVITIADDLVKGNLGTGDLVKGNLGTGDLVKGNLGTGDLVKGNLGTGDLTTDNSDTLN